MNRYSFTGPITRFNRPFTTITKPIITTATSPAKAKQNILYRIKKENNLIPSAKLELDEKNIKLI